MPLEDYKDIVAAAAGFTSIAQCFAPAFICKTIVKKGTAKGIDPLPFIGGIVISVLMLQHGLILNDPAMIPVNIFAFGLNLSYLACYYFYCPDKGSLLTSVAKAVAFVAALIGYAQYEKPELVEFRFGMIVTVLLLALIGAPLLSLGEIIRTKNTDSLPFPLISSGAVVTFLWLLYGIIIKNLFVQVQNAVFFTLTMMQLVLFFIFSSLPKKGEDAPNPDDTTDVATPDQTANDEPTVDSSKSAVPSADAAKTEPTADAAKSEPSADAAKTEPSVDASKAEPSADATKPETTADAAKTEQSADAAKTEPSADATKPETTADAAKTEQSADAAKTESPADAAKPETTADAAKTEPSADAAKTESSADATKTEPAADAAKTEPAGDASKTETAEESPKTEPAAGETKTESSGDAAKTEPVSNGAASEPAVSGSTTGTTTTA